jgi:hypothetical protein
MWYGINNMTEKQTTPSESQSTNETEIVTQADLDMFNDWTAAAQRTVGIDTASPTYAIPSTAEAPDSQPKPAKREVSPRVRRNRGLVAKGAAAVAGTALLAGAMNMALAPDEFSEETTTYSAEPGDGVWDAAEQIQGSFDMQDAVAHISADPANIDVLKDGLQQGEQLVIPVSVAGYEPADQDKK